MLSVLLFDSHNVFFIIYGFMNFSSLNNEKKFSHGSILLVKFYCGKNDMSVAIDNKL